MSHTAQAGLLHAVLAPQICCVSRNRLDGKKLTLQGGDLYSALRNHPETMRWDRLGRKVAMDVALGINYLHTRWVEGCASTLYLCVMRSKESNQQP